MSAPCCVAGPLKPWKVRLKRYNVTVARDVIPHRLARLLSSARAIAAIEVALVAGTFVLNSWYWAVSEHIVHLVVFFLSLLLWFAYRPFSSANLRFFFPAVFFALFLAWLCLSVIWSGAIHQSASYALLILLVGATGVTLGSLFGLRRVLQGVVAGTVFLQLHSLSVPDSQGRYAWEGGYQWGLFSNPSELSVLLGVGFLAAVFLAASKVHSNPARWVVALYLAWAIWFTFPILTTVIAVPASLAVLVPFLHARRVREKLRGPVLGGYLFVGIGAIVAFWGNRGVLLAPFGEDATLSMRTVIWAYYWDAVEWRPLSGAGWGNSYGWNPIEQDRLRQVVEFFPAHNGFIDTALMLGLVGLALLVGTLVSLFFAGLSDVVFGQQSFRHAFIPVLVVYLALNDMMATLLPKFMGIFLVGILVGLILSQGAKKNSKNDDPSALQSWRGHSSRI